SFSLVVQRDGVSSLRRTVPAAAVNPALFTVANTGSGQALAINENGPRNSPQQPGLKGHQLRLIGTGIGAIDGSGQPLAAVTAAVAKIPASVQAVAQAAGYPGGYSFIDIVVPEGAPAGDFIPIEVTVGGKTSQAGVTAALR